MLKKFKAFAGEPAPFVMELPTYHAPSMGNVLRATWERGWSFIKRAGTIILLSSIVLWFLQGYGFENGVLQAVEDNNASLLASIGSAVAWIFAPIGWVGDMGRSPRPDNPCGTAGRGYRPTEPRPQRSTG